jgi:hypothetical protein
VDFATHSRLYYDSGDILPHFFENCNSFLKIYEIFYSFFIFLRAVRKKFQKKAFGGGKKVVNLFTKSKTYDIII